MDYKALFEQTLKENEDLYEELEGKELLAKEYKEHKIEIKKLTFQVDALDEQATDFCLQKGKLKEDVKYWKNFALVYWSGNELGNLREAEKGPGGGEVWNEALRTVTDEGLPHAEKRRVGQWLNEKCMAD